MKINIQQIHQQKDQTLALQFETSFDDVVKSVRNLTGLSPLEVNVKLKRTGEEQIDVTGTLQGEMTLICSRCLKRFPKTVEVEIDEIYANQGDHEDSDFWPIEQGELDLTPMLRENLVLAIPFAPICAEDCKGLCSVCGNNRNIEPCSCEDQKIDPRFEKLIGLFDSKMDKK